MARSRFVRFCSVAAIGLLGACIASAPEGIRRRTDDDGVDPFSPDTTPPQDPPPIDPGSDPHAVLGASPSHGPFTGGQRVLVQGRGLSSDVRVWLGDAEVDPSSIIPVDPGRVQVVAPPGAAGPVDLTVQNGDDESTRRTLPAGYTYDALYAVPPSGPVSGGNVIEIHGQETAWDASTVARIDQEPCAALVVESATKLLCTVPKGTPGAKTIAVSTGDQSLLVLDGYTYEDSTNGFKGGLSGAPIAGKLKVLVYNNFTGDPIPAAQVIVGDSLATALTGQTDATGVKLFDEASLDGPRTVTIAATCHNPISFVAVPVDTVTVYLDPVLTPACAEGSGDPPPVGGKGGSAGLIEGELVWESIDEFQRGDWENIPGPQGPDERKAAYVFVVTSDASGNFYLPQAASAITPESPGDLGYRFLIYTAPGNRALYALAGIENRAVSPPRFTAYVMGAVRGIPVNPGEATSGVYLNMRKTLDQALIMDVTTPAPGPKGPDRLRASVSIQYGNEGYINLPVGVQTPYIPFSGDLAFVGVPSLTADLAGSSYVSTARAVTGPGELEPMSVVGRVLTNTTSQVVSIGDFVGVPVLATPALNGPWDGAHLATSFTAGAPVDLSVYDIASGNGLIRWTVAVPMGSHAIELPDLRQLGLENGALPGGSVSIGVYGARIDGFDYAKLRYRDMRPQGMTAYATDTFNAHL